MNLIGRRVEHKSKFGEGLVIHQGDDYIIVEFEADMRTRKFKYPDSIGTFLSLINTQTIEQSAKFQHFNDNKYSANNMPYDVRYVDFNEPYQYVGTVPVACFMNGKSVKIHKKPKWSKILTGIVYTLLSENNTKINELRTKPLLVEGMSPRSSNHKPFFASRRLHRRSYWIAYKYSGGYINIGLSVTDIIRTIRSLCLYCGVRLDEVIISVRQNEESLSNGKQNERHDIVLNNEANNVGNFATSQITQVHEIESNSKEMVDTTSSSFVHSASEQIISPKSLTAWLLTQPNSRGTLYLENVVRQYIYALRSAPTKLNITLDSRDRDVFSCQSPRKLNDLWDIFKSANNYRETNTSTSGMFSAGMGCLLRYLQFIEKQDGNISENIYLPDDGGLVKAGVICGETTIWNSTQRQQFQEWLERNNLAKSTAANYRRAINQIFRTFPEIVQKATIRTRSKPDAVQKCITLLKQEGSFIEANATRHNQFTAALAALERFHLEGKEDDNPITESTEPIIDKETSEAIDIILSEKFSNGFRYGSKIQIGQLRKSVNNILNLEIALLDEDIVDYVKSQGIEHSGKIYRVCSKTEDSIYNLAKTYFDNGAIAIFYTEFFSKHDKWLFESGVASENMLRKILQEKLPELNFTQTYFGKTKEPVPKVLRHEIERVWGDDVLLTYEKLSERLSYIPQQRIEQFLGSSNSGDFIWNSIGEYTHVSKIIITECEITRIVDFFETEINTHGYASLVDAPYGEIADHNHDLSRTAIQNGIFHICLADKFSQRGKIVTRKGVSVDALSIMRDYCFNIDGCTLDELLAIEEELTGERHRWIPMQAGYEVLIRTDENTFLAEKYVDFDIQKIDSAIEHYLSGVDYVPLHSVVSFAMFPPCGQAWNLYLLESYCRRFSSIFRFECLAVNSKNVGVIIRKSSQLNYIEVIADAITKSNIEPTDKNLLQFLYENGFIAKRSFSKIKEVIALAKK